MLDDAANISMSNKTTKDYVFTAASCYLELVESEFGTTMINPLPLVDHATKALKRNHTKLMNDRASGRPVHN